MYLKMKNLPPEDTPLLLVVQQVVLVSAFLLSFHSYNLIDFYVCQ